MSLLKVNTDKVTLERFVSQLDDMQVVFEVEYVFEDGEKTDVITQIDTYGRHGTDSEYLGFVNENWADHLDEHRDAVLNDLAARG